MPDIVEYNVNPNIEAFEIAGLGVYVLAPNANPEQEIQNLYRNQNQNQIELAEFPVGILLPNYEIPEELFRKLDEFFLQIDRLLEPKGIFAFLSERMPDVDDFEDINEEPSLHQGCMQHESDAEIHDDAEIVAEQLEAEADD
ncbi:unnamed protein product [Caenorhabditis angaria]|uniref:Uncharacterized protein n=1 Tax=Caenorhabditis angaria TaxID=860376 RepID=A0A9P1IZF2_9PELO|nr:unnamed protein product [Caenorhabditis angaria]